LILTPTAEGTLYPRLYHISKDPHCTEDVKARYPEILAAMRRALVRWIDERKETPISGIFPGGEPE